MSSEERQVASQRVGDEPHRLRPPLFQYFTSLEPFVFGGRRQIRRETSASACPTH